MKIHVVSFAPAHEERASVGGFEWRYDLNDALEEYEGQVANSREYDGSHVVRLLTMEVPDGLTLDDVTADLDARLNELEDEARAIKQYIPEDSQYPPTGGSEEAQ